MGQLHSPAGSPRDPNWVCLPRAEPELSQLSILGMVTAMGALDAHLKDSLLRQEAHAQAASQSQQLAAWKSHRAESQVMSTVQPWAGQEPPHPSWWLGW